MERCEVCYSDDESDKCEEWRQYWEALTPEQQREEERMMALYADEAGEP